MSLARLLYCTFFTLLLGDSCCHCLFLVNVLPGLLTLIICTSTCNTDVYLLLRSFIHIIHYLFSHHHTFIVIALMVLVNCLFGLVMAVSFMVRILSTFFLMCVTISFLFFSHGTFYIGWIIWH